MYINGRYLTQKITGVQRFGYEITKALNNISTNVEVIKPKQAASPQYDLDSFHVGSIGSKGGHIWEQYDLPKFLKQHSSPLLLNFCSTAPLLYNKQIVTIHDLAFLTSDWHSWPFRKFYSFLIPRIAKSARHILTVSEFSKHEICKAYNIDESRVTVIYNGITKPSVQPINDELCANYRNDKFILSVGSIDPRKNLKSLIKAFLKANLKHGDIFLYLVGAFNRNFVHDAELTALIDHPKIKFLGYCSDDELNWFYRNALMFVYPSLYEGFGLPPVEAMSNGCPVITSDRASLPEVCGDGAIYCDPVSVDDIAEKIDILLQNDTVRQKLIISGKSQASLYSWEKSASKLHDLLNVIS